MIKCEFENGNKASLRHLVVHAIVIKENKILLEKRASHLLEGGKWALPGGFVDRDETAEEATLRELREETGWTGKVLQLLRINTNPNRPHEDRQNIALDYIVEPIEQVGVGDQEVSDLEWFSLDNLPTADNLAFDHKESIELYLAYSNSKLK
jgi:ADP-ribose pyrophosphatase YjhB (NUDIX family)